MWMALHADAPMGEGGCACRWVGVRADGWVCMQMGGCACRWVGVRVDGWVGCVWISEWMSMRVDLQADGLIQRERLMEGEAQCTGTIRKGGKAVGNLSMLTSY